MGYTALIEMFLDHPVDSAQNWPCQYFYNLYSMHAQISIPMIATPQAILAGGCDNHRISAAAQFVNHGFAVDLCGAYQRHLPTNGAHWVHHGHFETGFTMGTYE